MTTGSVLGMKKLGSAIIRRLGNDLSMHQLLIIFRALLGLLWGGVRIATPRQARWPVQRFVGLLRAGLPELGFPSVGWMIVRPELERVGRLPDWYRDGPAAVEVGGGGRLVRATLGPAGRLPIARQYSPVFESLPRSGG